MPENRLDEQWQEMADLPLPALRHHLAAPAEGLTEGEAEERRERWGRNEVPRARIHPVAVFLAAFRGPLPFVIESAAVLSILVGHWADLALIAIIMVLNGAIRLYQAAATRRTLHALQEQLPTIVTVLRHGVHRRIPAQALVPGDTILLKAGDRAPADVRLLGTATVARDAPSASETPIPVDRHPGDVVYQGTVVLGGETRALVYATGRHTRAGKTTALVEHLRIPDRFQHEVDIVGAYRVVTTIVLVLLIGVTMLWRGTPLVPSLHFAVLVAVAGFPIITPAILALTLVAGARRLAGRHVVIRRLTSMERLAAMDILATGETGAGEPPLLDVGELTTRFEEWHVHPRALRGTTEEKCRTIRALQHRGHVVGMLGAHLSDAPPLRVAGAGLAIAGAETATIAAADAYLTRPDAAIPVDLVLECRRDLHRIRGYVTYRIAATIWVVLFTTLSVLILDYLPVNAPMLVLLAIFHDIAFLSIAGDHTRQPTRPVHLNPSAMRLLGTALGLVGVLGSFALALFCLRVLHLSPAVTRTLIYLNLSVGGLFTIFVTRTSAPFWSVRPGWPLLISVVATQLVATILSVLGFLMAPINWRQALAIWGYSLTVMVINDRVKRALARWRSAP